VVILVLTGLAFAAWLGTFYIFEQPERPDSYRILQRLHKIDPPKRFELTAAPAGEFLGARQLFERYSAMGSAELGKVNAELIRNYIRNYGQVRGLVPYLVGRYTIIEARELGPGDVFTSGMVALAASLENGQLLVEHLYPAEPSVIPSLKQTLHPGLEIKLERTHDLSALIHVERLDDGRLIFTAVPLLYGTYTMTRGPGMFRLEPPLTLNLAAGWPLFKKPERLRAELHFRNLQKEIGIARVPVVIPGISPTNTPPPIENALVRVEPAKPVETPAIVRVPGKEEKAAKRTATPKGRLAKKKKGALPSPVATALPAEQQPAVAQQSATVLAVSAATPPPLVGNEATPVPAAATPATAGETLASTAGGGTWRTFPPGRMPLGRLIDTNDVRDVAERGLAGERVYLRGQFVVNFSDANRAVMRPKKGLADTVLHFGGASTRIIVDFPAGYTPPRQGTVISRDETRPFEITDVQKRDDGQLNVFVREIMQPN
ncbi:MAG: hypothetical protein ACREIW_06830, partial [Chthoniobacterales bacterium]